MNRNTFPFVNTIKLNTKLVENCFDDVNEETARRKLNENINPVIFILLNVSEARYYPAKIIQ